MGGRNREFCILIGAAVGTLSLVPTNSLAQQEVFRQDPCTMNVVYATALAALTACAEKGSASQTVHPGIAVLQWYQRGGGRYRSGPVVSDGRQPRTSCCPARPRTDVRRG